MADFNVLFSECVKPVVGLGVGEADAFAGTKTSDVINAKNAGVVWAEIRNVSQTGTSTVTVEACDDVTPSNTAAIPFYYASVATATNVTTAAVKATASGFATTAGENVIYQITIDPSDIYAAASNAGYQYVRIKMVEVVNDPSTGWITLFVPALRFASSTPAAIIT